MDRTKALTAGAIVLTATGAVSALFLTVGAADNGTPPSASTEIVEYVDAAGNPLPAAEAGVAPDSGTPASAPAYRGEDEGEHGEEDHDEEEHEYEEHEGGEEHDDD